MRHRDEAPQPRAVESTTDGDVRTLGLTTATGTPPVVPTQPTVVGKHKAPTMPLIPAQKQPVHEPLSPAEAPVETPAEASVETPAEASVETPAEASVVIPAETPVETPAETPVEASVETPVETSVETPQAEEATFTAPHTARWRASHGPRMLAGVLLVLAVGGTSALGLQYQQDPGRDELISLAIGLVVVVGLWAMLIASTPQVVSLRGSVLTIHNSSGTERFDLADSLQPVDLVGEPHSSKWALVLHRANHTSLVLRRRDVNATQLDPVVRHYRIVAARTYAERQARFSS